MITKIIFTGSQKELKVNEGTFDFESNTWTAASESGSSAVLFSNPSTAEPQIMSVTVYYTTTSEVLEPSKAEIIDANGASAKTYSATATEVLQVPSFKSLDLTFPYDVSPLDLLPSPWRTHPQSPSPSSTARTAASASRIRWK